MQYNKLGSIGLDVSRLAMGTMTFGLQTDEATARSILDRVFEAGVTLIDTADVYPIGGTLETVGRTEEIVGRWLPGHRDRVVLATKAVGRVGPASWHQGASRKHIIEAFDASLKRLNTDYVDLYQLHSDDAATPIDETLEALDTLVCAGKVHYIGVSNFLAYRLALALGRSDLRGLARFVSVQPRYSLLFREIERELLPLAREQKLGVLAYNPLAGGFLSGKHKQPSNENALGDLALLVGRRLEGLPRCLREAIQVQAVVPVRSPNQRQPVRTKRVQGVHHGALQVLVERHFCARLVLILHKFIQNGHIPSFFHVR